MNSPPQPEVVASLPREAIRRAGLEVRETSIRGGTDGSRLSFMGLPTPNIFAGENMLETMARLVPGLGWLVPIPFYFMELLVGLVQALVFMLLTAVFTMLICEEEEGHEQAHG